jgi:iron complex transport system substrate-binding protein
MEELLRAAPQFAFLPRGDKRTATIEAAGIPVIQTAPNVTVAAISQLVTFYGSVFGEDAVVQAKRVTDYYAGAITTVDSRIRSVPEEQKPRVLVMQWHGGDAYIAFGRNTWQDDAIKLAGGRDVAANDIDGSKSDVSIEQILKWDPDVLILSDVNQTTAREVLSRPGWDQPSAVKNHRLFINPTGIYGFTSQVVEAFLEVQWMARTLYPDKFQDLDMHKETKHVLVDFYHYNVSDAEVDDILNATGVFHGA